MFASNQEFYAYVGGLIEKLRAAGEKEWVTAIKGAMRGGSTGGEVPGRLRVKLKEFQRSKAAAALGIKDEIGEVVKDLGRVLRQG